MSCKNKYIHDKCGNQKDCKETGEEMCFAPYPPRMTSDEFKVEQDKILADIPIEFRGSLSYMAYESGHSAGHEEVIGILRELVVNIKPAIEEFEKRITN